MSDLDKKQKKVYVDGIIAANAIRIKDCAKAKPNEKVKEYFKSKPYHMRKGREDE